jgi:sugar phosphate isomerase/epimerase
MRLANLVRTLAVLTASVAPARVEAQGVPLRYGVATFGEVEPLRDATTIAACGYDYIEPGLAKTLALPDPERQEQLRRLSATGLRVETMNWFLPGADIKLTGPAVDQARVNDFLERSLALAEQLGAKVIVFGSPGARSFPLEFPRERA